MAIKSFKNKTQRKTGVVDLGDGIELPIRTLSITDEASIKLTPIDLSQFKVTRKMTVEEQENMSKTDPNFNKDGKTIPFITVYDETNEDYQTYVESYNKLQNILNIIKYIDMDYEIETDNGIKTLWEDLDIERGDWTSVCQFFGEELCLSEKSLNAIFLKVQELQGESMFGMLDKLQKLTNLSYFEVLRLISKVQLEEKLEREMEEQTQENEETISIDSTIIDNNAQ